MSESVLGLIDRMAQVGLNHWGVVSADRYDESARAGVRTSDLFVDTISSLLFLGSVPIDHYLVSIGIDQT